MDETELLRMTRKQLAALAREARIPGRSRLAKNQLVAALAASAPQLPEATPHLSELPASYGRTSLTLMEVDPYWIYAYWEVTLQDCDAVSNSAGSEGNTPQWILRLFDVAGCESSNPSECSHFDVLIRLEAGNWYINLTESGKSYCAEIGVRAPSGRFIPVTRSNVAHLPIAGPSRDHGAVEAAAVPAPGRDAEPVEPPLPAAPETAPKPSRATIAPAPPATRENQVPPDAGKQESIGSKNPAGFPIPPVSPTAPDFRTSDDLSSFSLARPPSKIHE